MEEYGKKLLFDISDLISRSLSGGITLDEQERLDRWRAESDHNGELFERICSDLVAREKVEQYRNSDVQAAFRSFVRRRERRFSRLRRVWHFTRYAAAILLPLAGVFIYFNAEKRGENLVVALESKPIGSGRNMPELILSSGERMVLPDGDLSLQEKNGVQIFMKSGGEMEYVHSDSNGGDEAYNTLTTPAQCDFSFTLGDGTKVWLNAKSSLRYPVTFSGEERVVYAEGEVFLKVAKDREHPFFVVLDGMKIEVVGTAFNVNSYADEPFAEVTLQEGHVVTHLDGKSYHLLPDKQLCWNRKDQTVVIRTVDVNQYIAWKNGQYIFKGKRLAEVAKVLQRWYDVEIVFERDDCAQAIYTGVIYKEESFDEFVIRLRETSGFDCLVEDRKLFIK